MKYYGQIKIAKQQGAFVDSLVISNDNNPKNTDRVSRGTIDSLFQMPQDGELADIMMNDLVNNNPVKNHSFAGVQLPLGLNNPKMPRSEVVAISNDHRERKALTEAANKAHQSKGFFSRLFSSSNPDKYYDSLSEEEQKRFDAMVERSLYGLTRGNPDKVIKGLQGIYPNPANSYIKRI